MTSISIRIAVMFNFVKKIGIAFILVVSLFISGCASNIELKQPLSKSNRVGIVANFKSVALFQRAGTTSVDNASFYRQVPGLNMGALATTIVSNHLYRSRKFKVIPIYHRPVPALLSARVARRKILSPEYRDYLSKLSRRKRLDKIVLITPGDIDFGDGQYFGAIWWVTGYGLFNRDFIFMRTNTVFAAYKVYVIDAKTGQVLAKATGDLQSRIHGIHITWHKGYAGVSSSTLRAVRNVLRRRMPASLIAAVHKTGLP